jgi:hypothetical protein
MARKNPVVEALDAFLADIEPSGVALVRAEMARKLAAAAETAPPYALPRVAFALEELLSELSDGPAQEASSRAAARIIRAIQ